MQFPPNVYNTLERPRWDERCRYLLIKGAVNSRWCLPTRLVKTPWWLNTPSTEGKGHSSDSPKQGPRMLAIIRAACWAFDSNRVLLCFLTGSLFTYLCLHLLRRIAFKFPLRREEKRISGWTLWSLCSWQNWAVCSHCKHKQDDQIGFTKLILLLQTWFLWYQFSFCLSLSAHNCRYLEFRMVGDSCSLVSPFFSWTFF